MPLSDTIRLIPPGLTRQELANIALSEYWEARRTRDAEKMREALAIADLASEVTSN